MPTEKNIQNNIFMRTTLFTVILFLTNITVEAQDPARIRLTDTTLMHEMRATPYPQDKAVISDRSISFQWPLLVDLDTQDKTLKALIAQAARTKTDKNILGKHTTSHNRKKCPKVLSAGTENRTCRITQSTSARLYG